MIINDAKYYESNSATSSDAQGDTTLDPETVTPISNRKEKVTDTNNGNFEQKLLSNRTILVVVLTMNLSIDPRIVPTVAVPQTLLTPETKEVVADAACDRAKVNRTLRRVSRTGVNIITPVEVFNAVSVNHDP